MLRCLAQNAHNYAGMIEELKGTSKNATEGIFRGSFISM